MGVLVDEWDVRLKALQWMPEQNMDFDDDWTSTLSLDKWGVCVWLDEWE